MNAPLVSLPAANGTVALRRADVLLLRAQWQTNRQTLLKVAAITAALAALLCVTALLLWPSLSRPDAGPDAIERTTLPASVAESAAIYDTEVMPLAPEDASAINAERPVDIARVIPAAALRLAAESAQGVGFGAALRCLTQAVYYEAASEPDEGQRAVAQVVLNRVRHPAFPNTVCGVVYQGSERVTGCQFSFTCDGSLARRPSLGGWARAERIARDALGGRVAAAVGNATHYHANYVVPYWAPTLDKAATVGAHIFYLMRGYLGSPRAFTARYDVARELSPLASTMVSDEIAPAATLVNGLVASNDIIPGLGSPIEDAKSGSLISGEGAPALKFTPPAALRADEQRGTIRAGSGSSLKADDGGLSNAGSSSETETDG